MFLTKRTCKNCCFFDELHRNSFIFQQPPENMEIVGKPKKNMVPGSWPGNCVTGDCAKLPRASFASHLSQWSPCNTETKIWILLRVCLDRVHIEHRLNVLYKNQYNI